MIKKVVILSLSEKWGKKCVACYDMEAEKLIRLVSEAESGDGIEAEHLRGVNLLNEVEIKIIKECPLGHQTENVLIDLNFGIRKTTRIAKEKLVELMVEKTKRPNKLFGGTYYKASNLDNVDYSLQLVKFEDLQFELVPNAQGQKKTKARFIFDGEVYSGYAITDKRFFSATDSISSGYMLVSIPPSDDFTAKNGYFKYVSAIF